MTRRAGLSSLAGATWGGLCLVLGSAGPAPAQTWTEMLPSGTPPEVRLATQAAYDHVNDRLIVFGGDVSTPHTHPNDVWVLIDASGALGTPQWMQVSTIGGPPSGRVVGTLAYDPTSNRAILHGGCGEPFGLNHCSPGFRDAWYLTNANGLGGPAEWFPLPPSNVDSFLGRELHTAAYDGGSNRMIVFGGSLPFFFTARNDVELLLDANGIGSPSWTFLPTAGPLPPARSGHSAAYDQASNRLIVFGGENSSSTPSVSNDVWVLSHANGVGGTAQWTQLTPVGGPPPARTGHSAHYDASSNRMIVFGGASFDCCGNFQSFFNDVWVLTNANGMGGLPEWVDLAPNGTPPLGRFQHAAGYSSSRNRMIVTTGHNRLQPSLPFEFNDVWVLEDANGIRSVEIDVKPGAVPNSINPGSGGAIPVAILTDPGFDATTVDPMTARFGPSGATEAHGRGHIEDVDGDGDLDLLLHFRTRSTGIPCGATSASLTAQTLGGQGVAGSDSIATVSCSGP